MNSNLVAAIAALVFIAGTVCRVPANTYDHLGVDAVISETPQIVAPSPQPPGNRKYTYYRINGTRFAGYVVPDEVQEGVIAGNRGVLVVPLESLGTRGSFAALVWRGTGGDWHYVGYIPSSVGNLQWWIEAGYLQVLTPIYKPSDANCCPSAHRHALYTVDGTKLVEVKSATIARGDRLPQWLYIEPGARAFLGTDGEDDAVALVCPKPIEANESCIGRTEGMPIVIDAIAPAGEPCTHNTKLKIHAVDGSWKGYASIDAVQAPIPAGALLELRTPPQSEPFQAFATRRNVTKDPGIAIDATLRVVRFDPRTNDPSGSTRDTLVAVTSGSHAGAQGWVFSSATTVKTYWVPPAMVCANDERALSI